MAKTKYAPDEVLVATRSFGMPGRVINRGDKVRANDPCVGDGRFFVVDGTPMSEWGDDWTDVVVPEPEKPPVTVISSTIPRHRMVRSLVDVARPVPYAKGSPGETSGKPPAFMRAVIRREQIFDVVHLLVRQHPDWFEWAARDVRLDDIERAQRLATLEEESRDRMVAKGGGQSCVPRVSTGHAAGGAGYPGAA